MSKKIGCSISLSHKHNNRFAGCLHFDTPTDDPKPEPKLDDNSFDLNEFTKSMVELVDKQLQANNEKLMSAFEDKIKQHNKENKPSFIEKIKGTDKKQFSTEEMEALLKQQEEELNKSKEEILKQYNEKLSLQAKEQQDETINNALRLNFKDTSILDEALLFKDIKEDFSFEIKDGKVIPKDKKGNPIFINHKQIETVEELKTYYYSVKPNYQKSDVDMSSIQKTQTNRTQNSDKKVQSNGERFKNSVTSKISKAE